MKVRFVSDKRICLYVNYKQVGGRWSKYAQTIQKANFPSTDDLNAEIQTCLDRMQDFYQKNHDHDADDKPDSADEADAADNAESES